MSKKLVPPGLVYDEADIDAVTRTMLGEAAGEGDEGLAAVAHVLANRLEKGGYGKSLYSVAHAPKQFSAWNNKGNGGNNLVNVGTDDPRYQRARAIAEEVLNGRHADNTGGAVNYFAPAGMTGRNGTVKGEPAWAAKMSYTGSIGGHRFYSDGSAAAAAERLANGSDVAGIQQQLASRGFDPGVVDGVRGPRTDAAIRAFQKANGLVVDGIVGPKTMAALQSQERPHTMRQPPPSGSQSWFLSPAALKPLPSNDFSRLPDTYLLTPEQQVQQDRENIGLNNGVGHGPRWGTLDILKDLSAGKFAAPEPKPLPTTGGFNLFDKLGQGANFLGAKAQEAGKALGDTAGNMVEGTKTAVATTANNAADLLKNELIGTVKGRTLLLNTALGINPNDPFRYGATAQERQENARRRQAMMDGVPFVPSMGVRTYVDIPKPLPGTTKAKPQALPVAALTALQRRQAQQADFERRGLNAFGMLS